MTLQPFSDQAVMAYFADEAAALRFAAAVHAAAPPWLIDVVSAYRSVAVFFDLDQADVAQVTARLQQLDAGGATTAAPGRLHHIPCCYDFPLDQARIADRAGLSIEDMIRLHTATEYTVYAIGFCPGFPYLGYLP